MRIIEFYGMRRSGNHAIIQWIINNFYTNLINLEKVNQTKLLKVHGSEGVLFLNDYTFNGNDRHILNNCLSKELDLLIISYENIPLNKSALIKGVDSEKIVLIRSFRNWFASFCKKKPLRPGVTVKECSEQWLNKAEFVKNNYDNKGAIYYDDWLVNKDYREQIAKLNDFPFLSDELGFDTSGKNGMWFGDGSSFENTPTNEIDKEKLLNRHLHYDGYTNLEKSIKNDIESNYNDLDKFI